MAKANTAKTTKPTPAPKPNCGVCGVPVAGNTVHISEDGYTLCRDCNTKCQRVDIITGEEFVALRAMEIVTKNGAWGVTSRDTIGKIKNDLRKCTKCGHYYVVDPDSPVEIVRKVGREHEDVAYLVDTPDSCAKCIELGTARGWPIYYQGCAAYSGGVSSRDTLMDLGPDSDWLKRTAPRKYGRSVGIEVECAPTPLSQAKMLSWFKDIEYEDQFGYGKKKIPTLMVTAEDDRSLRAPQRVEYKSPVLFESSYEEWVDEFTSRLVCNLYNRCGLHIHIGSADIPWYGIWRLAQFCAKYEKTFIGLVSPTRIPQATTDGSGRPLLLPASWRKATVRTKSDLIRLLYGTDRVFTPGDGCPIRNNKRANDQGGPRYFGSIHRYQWLNLHAHFHQRTIEIRLHQSTASAEKIKNWVRFWFETINHVCLGSRPLNELKDLTYLTPPVYKYYAARAAAYRAMKEEYDRTGRLGPQNPIGPTVGRGTLGVLDMNAIPDMAEPPRRARLTEDEDEINDLFDEEDDGPDPDAEPIDPPARAPAPFTEEATVENVRRMNQFWQTIQNVNLRAVNNGEVVETTRDENGFTTVTRMRTDRI